MSEDLELLMAERAIQRVLTSYSRGVDRFDFESVRSVSAPPMTSFTTFSMSRRGASRSSAAVVPQ